MSVDEGVFLGMPGYASPGVGYLGEGPAFPIAARKALSDAQLRSNLHAATRTIRDKRSRAVAEVPDWELLRDSGSAVKADTMARLPELLEQLESAVVARGGSVHWARDATEANAIIVDLVRATGSPDVLKIKSMVTQEIGLNAALRAAGIDAWETDLAELIVQLSGDRPSHLLVPAIHRNRAEIRDIFLAAGMPGVPASLTDDPQRLAMAARDFLRQRFLSTTVSVGGANFAVADSGALVVVESEGNGRMCLTLPRTLITVMGVEKVVPTWRDLEIFLQVLPRSATGERMNPYTSVWSGVVPGDGPQEFHLVLLDNGRSAVLADELGRSALHCIRCSACLNVCPVYERVGGHAYGSVYQGPIGAVLSPQLTGRFDSTLPFASTLCGACLDACPVKIDIPAMLVHLRTKHVDSALSWWPEPAAAVFRCAAWVMSHRRAWALLTRASRAARVLGRRRGVITWAPPPLRRWTSTRDLPRPPGESFSAWWARERRDGP